jgi:hypothetical protein
MFSNIIMFFFSLGIRIWGHHIYFLINYKVVCRTAMLTDKDVILSKSGITALEKYYIVK